jgi:hypothetical protein
MHGHLKKGLRVLLEISRLGIFGVGGCFYAMSHSLNKTE